MSEQIDRALEWGAERIRDFSETPRLDAELLLAYCLERPRSFLYGRPELILDEDRWKAFQALVEKRIEPTPVAYLLGQREFYSLDFLTSPVALVPRPETELLVEMALELIPADKSWRVLDLGTGTGIIAITLKLSRPRVEMTATDVDRRCLELARRNAARHQVEIEWLESDWYQAVGDPGGYDLIVSNPPYIAGGHPFLARGDLPAEPRLALSPGTSGLEALERIIGQAPEYLVAQGWLIVEHGYDQQAQVRQLLEAQDFTDIYCGFDLNNLPRTTRAKHG